MAGGRGRGYLPRTVSTMMLELVPPVFHVVLLTALTFFTFYFHPASKLWHLTAIFVVAQIISNWVQFLANKSVILASRRNYPGYVHRYPSLTSSRDSRETTSEYQQLRLRRRWRECEWCDMHVPTRSHHCGHCGRCIYALDHHCYFLGHCVGRTNLRFFIVFCIYACVGSAMGVYTLVDVMQFYRNLWATDQVAYYVLPCTIILYLMGSAQAFEVMYVALINFGLGAIGATAFLGLSGLKSSLTGRTPYEERRSIREEDEERDDAPSAHFNEVFGPYGFLHFFIPYLPFEGPKAEEGYRRIITYNDYILNGTVHTSDTP